MTTPTTPANSLSVSQVSDEINPAGYVQGQQNIGANVVVRKLTGSFKKNQFFIGNPLEIGADLSNKIAFSEILVVNSTGGVIANTSNTRGGISSPQSPVTATLTFLANTDMHEPNINWTFTVNPGSLNVTNNDIVVTRNFVVNTQTNRPSSKSANVALKSLSGTKIANLTITGTMTVPNYDTSGRFEIGQHTVNVCTKNVVLVVNALDTNFQITATPALTVNATGQAAQTASIILKATASLGGPENYLPGVSYDKSLIPSNFNWIDYIYHPQNGDLLAANIDSKIEAERHYALFGIGEGRLYNGNSQLENVTFRFTPTFVSGTGPISVIYAKTQTPSGGVDDYLPGVSYDVTLIPADFNWLEYIYHPNNSDLLTANIDTKIEAERHYALFGLAEGRPYFIDGDNDTIAFTATAAKKAGGSVNTAIYSVLTEMLLNGNVVATNICTVDLRAQFVDRQITSLTPTALTNNQFSNSSSQYSTIDITAIHNSIAPTYEQGTVTFTLNVTGDAVTQSTISSNTSAKTERISLYHNKDTDGFGFKKAVVIVTAELRAPDNSIMDIKSTPPITLRAGTYGLSLNKPPSNTQIGYAAQTATSFGSATWGAGTFTWTPRQFNGSGPQLVQDNQVKTSTITITALAPSGKNATQAVSNACNYDLTATLSYDGITVVSTVLGDILIKAESLPYTYSLSLPATSNTQMEVDGAATATVTATGSVSTGTITFTRDNSNVGLTTQPTTATLQVTSPPAGGTNTQSVILTGTLRDASSRVIEALSTPTITLDAATTKLQILGSNVAITSNAVTAEAVGVFEATSVIGTPTLLFPPAKQSGQDLQLFEDSPTRQRIVAQATQGSKSAVYRLTGIVDYKGIVKRTTRDASISVGAVAPSLTITKNSFTYSEYSRLDDIGSIAYFSYTGVDLVAETDYAGSINTDYTIRLVVNVLGDGPNTILRSGPFYNQAAVLPIVNTTTGLPTGYAGSVNKRRDRIQSTEFTTGSLKYNLTYELYDSNNNFLVSNTVSDDTTVAPPTTGQVALNFVSGTNAVLTITNKPNNGNGYPEPNPLQVISSQTVNYSATYTSTGAIPTPRFAFSFPNRPGDNVTANRTITANTINGLASVTVSSVYNDAGPSIIDGNGLNSIQVQLTSVNPTNGEVIFLGDPKALTDRYTVAMPPGRCYRLSTFSYGPRMYHTRDVFSNSNEVIDYSRIPSSSSLSGPETKFLGFHDGSTIYALSGRPLYSTNTRSAIRYYSSDGHRISHGSETPNAVIPAGYFMVMSFAETGAPSLGAITFIGSDGLAYPCGGLWAQSLTTQNDTSRDNDAFNWFIFEPPTLPAGVTTDYVFISNGGYIAPPTGADNISFTAVQPGNAFIAQYIKLNIGTVSGGLVEEDQYIDPRDPRNIF